MLRLRDEGKFVVPQFVLTFRLSIHRRCRLAFSSSSLLLPNASFTVLLHEVDMVQPRRVLLVANLQGKGACDHQLCYSSSTISTQGSTPSNDTRDGTTRYAASPRHRRIPKIPLISCCCCCSRHCYLQSDRLMHSVAFWQR